MPGPLSESLRRLGLTLPPPPRPVGSYSPVRRSDRLAWVSGQIVTHDGVANPAGLVDRDVDVETAAAAARTATLQALSALAAELQSVDRIARPLRVAAYVASSPGFTRAHVVANGATDLLVQLFGDEERPARVAMGVVSLPLGAPVEIELLVETR